MEQIALQELACFGNYSIPLSVLIEGIVPALTNNKEKSVMKQKKPGCIKYLFKKRVLSQGLRHDQLTRNQQYKSYASVRIKQDSDHTKWQLRFTRITLSEGKLIDRNRHSLTRVQRQDDRQFGIILIKVPTISKKQTVATLNKEHKLAITDALNIIPTATLQAYFI